MARIESIGFDITAAVEAKFWTHGIRIEQVEAVLEHPWTVIRNR